MEVTIKQRFNGPPASANGGYICGILAKAIGGPCEVRLNSPPPLEKNLRIQSTIDGASLFDNDTLIAEGKNTEINSAPCTFVSYNESQEYATNGLHFYSIEHPIPGCFVCGTERKAGDGMRLFAGPELRMLDEGEHYPIATNWSPDSSLSEDGKVVDEEFVWSAMDCPSGWAVKFGRDRNAYLDSAMLLGKFANEIFRLPRVDENCIVVAEYCSADGRKIFTKATLYSSDRELLANGLGTWIILKP